MKDCNSPLSSAILHMTPLFIRYAYMSVPLALKVINMPCSSVSDILSKGEGSRSNVTHHYTYLSLLTQLMNYVSVPSA